MHIYIYIYTIYYIHKYITSICHLVRHHYLKAPISSKKQNALFQPEVLQQRRQVAARDMDILQQYPTSRAYPPRWSNGPNMAQLLANYWPTCHLTTFQQKSRPRHVPKMLEQCASNPGSHLLLKIPVQRCAQVSCLNSVGTCLNILSLAHIYYRGSPVPPTQLCNRGAQLCQTIHRCTSSKSLDRK